MENKIENGAVSIVNWTGIMCVGSLVRALKFEPSSERHVFVVGSLGAGLVI